MLFFNFAQTFYLDKSAVQNATEVALSRVDLFFRAKPPATNNKSGIEKPGVEVMIVPCLNGIPVINQMGAYRPTEPTEHGAKFAFYSGGQTARVEYDGIQASTNAVVPTTFLFDLPIFVHTDAEYAIIVKFDGNENYILWEEVVGEVLVGSGNICTGPSGNFSGKLFQYIDDINKTPGSINDAGYAYSNSVIGASEANNAALIYTASVLTTEQTDTRYLQSNWSPLPGTALKLAIWAGRYAIAGESVMGLPDYWANSQLTSTFDRIGVMYPGEDAALSNGVLQLIAPAQSTEYIRFDLKNTTKDDLYYGEPFYQDGPMYPGGRASPITVNCAPTISGANVDYAALIVRANGSYTYDNGSTFAATGGFNSLFSVGDMMIFNIPGNTEIHIRSVDAINSNTELVVNQPFDTTLTGANFRKSPVAYLNDVTQTYVFGKLQDLCTLYNSTANSTVRFTSFSLANATIVTNGTSYSNNDYIKVSGFEDFNPQVQGNYAAYANIVTNANGSITAVYFSNTGAGFTNSSFLVGANVAIYQSSGGVPSVTPTAAGVNANITFGIGSNIKSVFGLTSLANCELINIEVMRMKPEITVNNPLGSSFTIKHRTLYHAVDYANSHTGRAYYVDTPAENAQTEIYSKIFKAHTLGIPADNKTPVLPSRSNEFVIRFANGATSDSNTYGDYFSNAACLIFTVSSNSDYQAVYFDPEIMMTHYGKYIINNDYTNEHTNYGNAFAKHVATKINMATDRSAEDVLVYLTAYRPANTDFKVYARIHNTNDPDAFDDTEWTLLEQTDGIGMYSSKSDDSDYIELTYGLPAYPNTDYTMTGSVTVKQGNSHLVGSGTIFGPMANVVGGGTGYNNNDIIYFTAPTGATDDNTTGITASKASVNAKCTINTNGSGVIQSFTAITDVGYGFTSQQPYTTFTAVTNTGVASAGTGASLKFTPGLQSGDLIKIYSPYVDFANTNYTTAVVNNVVSNTDLVVKRVFGEIGANQAGTVAITNNSVTITGTSTFWNLTFDVGDWIAIWGNSSVYEAHKIATIVSNTSITMDSVATMSNTASNWALLKSQAFLNVSTSVSNLLVDRLAYPHQAFNNMQNDNVARYYNSSMIEYDAYDTVQIKIVLLSDSDVTVPKADDVRGILVTA